MSVTVGHYLAKVKALPEGRPTDYTVGVLAFNDSPAAFCVALVLTISVTAFCKTRTADLRSAQQLRCS